MSLEAEKEKLFKRLQEIISAQLGIEQSLIKVDSNFAADLEADSLDLVELVMTFEEIFDITIEDDNAGEFATVQDAIDFIIKQKGN